MVLLAATGIVDRLIYFRGVSWWYATLKGVGAIYSGCEANMVEAIPLSGRQIIEKCDPDVPLDFVARAQHVIVYPRGCTNQSVVAWGPEIQHWAETWMPFAPRGGRVVLFEDHRTKFVPLDEFGAFGCP
jgi:hypothetical protein